ncbi:MAG: winged helix-turn-helix domain-containing protein, partial [Gammaproteobacteria bacterium]|nr:winged helix-turn-helix domain-containing protein [Gammaproteobacteria bacterium]
SSGAVVDHVGSGSEADAALMTNNEFDLLILDLGLPRMHGLEVLKRLRSRGSALPVLILTAADGIEERVKGLDLGADDYMAKPFSPRELVARVRARLRRSAAPADTTGWQQLGRFSIDREGSRIRFGDQPLDLTRYEYALMAALLQRPGAILSRAQLMDRGWDSDADSADRTVDTHVKTLRAKLRAAGAETDPIRTHRGLGYALEV